ncbi:MAG: FUSC family protein [Sphingomonadales bacterium]|nr:FUSC family protein [Sphingomonadales bacterium]
MPGGRTAALVFSFNCLAAAMLALLIGFSAGLPAPYWAMTTAYIVSHPLAGATRSKAVYRVFGTFIGAAAAVALVPALVNAPLLLSLALAAWVGACLFVSLLDRSPRAYVLMLAGYTAAIIAFPCVDRPEAIFDTASARVTEIVLGILCATLTHSVLFPRPVGDALRGLVAAWLDDAEGWLRDCLAGASGLRVASDRRHLAVDVVELELLATHLPFDTSHLRETTGAVRALLARMLLLIPLLSGLADRRQALAGRGGRELDATLAATGQWLDAGSPLAGLPALRQRIDRQTIDPGRAGWNDLLAASLLGRLEQAVVALGECRALLRHLDDPLTPLPPGLQAAVAAAPAPRFHRDIPFAALSGAAAVIAIFACCALWIGTGWADGAGAAMLTAVFCCMFAALDNPVPAILRFGGCLLASVPLAAVYMFAVLPAIDGFAELCLALAPALLALGVLIPHPRYGALAMPVLIGLCNALALQESFTADFARFLNINLAQLVAVGCAAAVTATVRSLGADVAITRLLRQVRRDLLRLAEAAAPPDGDAVLARTVDQLALLTPRLGNADAHGANLADRGLRALRLMMNIVAVRELVQQLGRQRRPRVAVMRLLRTAAVHFRTAPPGELFTAPAPALLPQIDRALALLIGAETATPADRTHGLAALVALRRNLFPDAPGYVAPTPAGAA